MNYTLLLNRIKNFVFIPGIEWKTISEENPDKKLVLSQFILPIIGIATFVAFVSYLIYNPGILFSNAVAHAFSVFLSLLGGLFLSAFILNQLNPAFKLVGHDHFYLIAYASLPVFLVNIFYALFPELEFIRMFSFYSAFIVWQSIDRYYKQNKNSQVLFVLAASSLIIFIPFIIKKALMQLQFLYY